MIHFEPSNTVSVSNFMKKQKLMSEVKPLNEHLQSFLSSILLVKPIKAEDTIGYMSQHLYI